MIRFLFFLRRLTLRHVEWQPEYYETRYTSVRNSIRRIHDKRNARHPCVIPPLCLGLSRPLESEMERGEPQNEDDDRCIIECHILRADSKYIVVDRSFPLIVRRFLNDEHPCQEIPCTRSSIKIKMFYGVYL